MTQRPLKWCIKFQKTTPNPTPEIPFWCNFKIENNFAEFFGIQLKGVSVKKRFPKWFGLVHLQLMCVQLFFHPFLRSHYCTWECLEAQWRRTFSTRMVAAVLMTLSLRRLRSLQLPPRWITSSWFFDTGDKSRGLLLAEVAMANAAAAVDVLLLNKSREDNQSEESAKKGNSGRNGIAGQKGIGQEPTGRLLL